MELPPTLQPELAVVIVTRGLDRNLQVWPEEKWSRFAERLSGLPLVDHEARALRRRLFGGAAQQAPDRSGRISLPIALRAFAGITREVVVVGLYDHLEVWSAENWAMVLQGVEDFAQVERWDGMAL
jgi:MraZ protein